MKKIFATIGVVSVLGMLTAAIMPPPGGGTTETILATATNLPNVTVTNAAAFLSNASVATNLTVGQARMTNNGRIYPGSDADTYYGTFHADGKSFGYIRDSVSIMALYDTASFANRIGIGQVSASVPTVFLVWDADNTLAQRNALVAQTNRIYGTWTDANNGEWIEIRHEGAGTATPFAVIAASENGTGVDNQGIKLLTKGTGAFIVDSASTTAGNARGTYAVDLQLERVAAGQVASGAQATMIGGYRNTASGDTSAVIGGRNNIASGQYSIAYGAFSTAYGNSSSAGGSYASSGLDGQESYSSGIYDGAGLDQTFTVRAGRLSALNVATNLTTTGGALAAGTALVLPNNTTWLFEGQVVAHSMTAGSPRETAGYKISGGITRGANAAATAIVGTPSISVLWEADAAWDVTLAADTTLGALDIKGTGNDETNRWVTTLYVTQVGGTE